MKGKHDAAKDIFIKEIKKITTLDAIIERINQFGAMKESFFEQSLEQEESILFWVYELDNNVWYEPLV